jgi:hypothetical protein
MNSLVMAPVALEANLVAKITIYFEPQTSWTFQLAGFPAAVGSSAQHHTRLINQFFCREALPPKRQHM